MGVIQGMEDVWQKVRHSSVRGGKFFKKNLPKKIGNFLAAFGHQSPEFFSIGAKLTRYLEVELTYWKDLNSIP